MLLNSSRNRNFSPRGKITSARINQNGNFHQIQILSRSLCLPSVTKTIEITNTQAKFNKYFCKFDFTTFRKFHGRLQNNTS